MCIDLYTPYVSKKSRLICGIFYEDLNCISCIKIATQPEEKLTMAEYMAKKDREERIRAQEDEKLRLRDKHSQWLLNMTSEEFDDTFSPVGSGGNGYNPFAVTISTHNL